jgi:transcriptional regulator with XRE-family HTH domain
VEKSVSSKEYKLFLHLLRVERRRAGVTQADLAERLKETQTFVSKCERGERRIDVVELRAICKALGTSFTAFVKSLDSSLNK